MNETISSSPFSFIDNKNVLNTLQKTDRIVAGDETIQVLADNNIQMSVAYAHPQTKRIFFDLNATKQILSMDGNNTAFDFVTLVKGVNYHELAHLFYTDYSEKVTKEVIYNFYKDKISDVKIGEEISLRYKHKYFKCYKKNKHSYIDFKDIHSVLNVIEDGRIETLFSLKYPRAKYYFTFSLSKLSSPAFLSAQMQNRKVTSKQLVTLYMLWYGRKSLFDVIPSEIGTIRTQLIKIIPEKLIRLLEYLIDEFIVQEDTVKRLEICNFVYMLVDSVEKDGDRASDALNTSNTTSLFNRKKSQKEASELLKDLKEEQEKQNKDYSERPQTFDEKELKKLMEELAKDGVKSKQNENEEEEEGEKQEQKDQSGDLQQEGQGKGEEQEEEEGEDGEDAQSSGEASSNSNKQQQKDAGRDSQKQNKPNTPKEFEKNVGDNIMKILETQQSDIKAEIEDNESVRNEIEQDIEQLAGSNSNEIINTEGKPLKFGEIERMESGRIELLLRKIRGELSGQVQKFKSSGEVDMASVIKAKKSGDFKVFSKTIMNQQDKARLGVSFILDASGSVQHEDFETEIKAVFCFSKALENLKSKVSVIEFSGEHRTMKVFNGTGDWRRTMNGGTQLTAPMKEGIKQQIKLRRTDRINNNYIVVVSDGDFSERGTTLRNLIEEAHREKIKVIWVLVKGYDVHENEVEQGQMFDGFTHIQTFTDLSQKLQEIVRKMQMDVLINLQRGLN